jgi:hypothetical protein
MHMKNERRYHVKGKHVRRNIDHYISLILVPADFLLVVGRGMRLI